MPAHVPSLQVPQTIMSEWIKKGNLNTTHHNAQQWTITTQLNNRTLAEACSQSREKMGPLVYVANQQKILPTGVLDVGDANPWEYIIIS